MNLQTFWPWILVGVGAIPGAWLRWQLGLWLNPTYPNFPIGTWLSNALGGLLIGILASLFQCFPHIDPAWRLALITGFLGAFTTFSTFSLEVSQQIMAGKLDSGAWIILAHLSSSVLSTICGFLFFAWAHKTFF
jgi:CrcB protein